MTRFFASAVAVALATAAVTGWAAPGRTFMKSPTYGDCRARRPVFSWTAAADANQYLLSITRNGTKYVEKWTRKTAWAPRFDLPEGVYEARVIAYDGVAYGQWSGRVKFRRVFTPAVSSINGLVRDGGNVQLVAGEGVVIESVASNNSVIISAGGITSTQIVELSVTTEKIDNAAVTTAKLADNAVYGAKLADGAVTSAKLADGAVTSNKIAAGHLLLASLASGQAGVGQYLKWNGTQWEPAGLYAGYAEGSIAVASSAGAPGAIALGESSDVLGQHSAILGGDNNQINSGANNSVIVGGTMNVIRTNSSYSAIIGGYDNYLASSFSLSAGRKAKATNEGAFVWSDSTVAGVGSWGPNTVVFKANGGVRFQSDTPGTANHRVQWVPGDTGWNFSSDRNLKEGFEPVDGRVALEKVAALPMTTWRYKGYTRAHIGVMAQDFHTAFPLEGSTDTMIDSGDLQGVSLAAIQGLHAELKAERARNDALEARLTALEASLPR